MSDNLPAPTDPGRWPILADKSSEITVASTQRRKLAVRVLPILGIALFVAGLVAPSLSSSLWPVMLCWMGGLGAFAALTLFIPSAPAAEPPTVEDPKPEPFRPAVSAPAIAAPGRRALTFSALPVRLGEPITVHYERPRADNNSKLPRLTASVRCEEWILNRTGDYNKRARTADAWRADLMPLPSDPSPTANTERESWQFQLPAELPPSFDSTHYKIRWFVTIRAEASRLGKPPQDFGFPVAPEVFRDLR